MCATTGNKNIELGNMHAYPYRFKYLGTKITIEDVENRIRDPATRALHGVCYTR